MFLVRTLVNHRRQVSDYFRVADRNTCDWYSLCQDLVVYRARQSPGWIFLSPLLGMIQAFASFALIMLQRKQLGSSDLHRLLLGIAVVYGCSWFVPAFLVSD